MDIEEILGKRRLRETEIWIALDEDALDEIADLEQQLARAEDADLRTRHDALVEQAQANGAVARFAFRQLPARTYRQLIESYPSEKPGLRWDEATFAPALIAACCTEPAMTVDQAKRIGEEWGEDAFLLLYGTALQVNDAQPRVPFSVRHTNGTTGSPSNSTSASETTEP